MKQRIYNRLNDLLGMKIPIQTMAGLADLVTEVCKTFIYNVLLVYFRYFLEELNCHLKLQNIMWRKYMTLLLPVNILQSRLIS